MIAPLIFITFINDLPSSIDEGKIVLYADDTTMVVRHRDKSSATSLLDKNMQGIKEWIDSNGLKLNDDKTE